MKRSDMIDIVVRTLEDLINRPSYSMSFHDQARYILDRIENCGMLPPTIRVPSGCLHTMREPCDCAELYGKKNEWEKEQ